METQPLKKEKYLLLFYPAFLQTELQGLPEEKCLPSQGSIVPTNSSPELSFQWGKVDNRPCDSAAEGGPLMQLLYHFGQWFWEQKQKGCRSSALPKLLPCETLQRNGTRCLPVLLPRPARLALAQWFSLTVFGTHDYSEKLIKSQSWLLLAELSGL